VKYQTIIITFVGFFFISCKKREAEVTNTETRIRTTKDEEAKLFATSDEQFRNTPTSPVIADAPSHWLARPATEFRLLNYAFGESGKGEVYVSISQGSVKDNANRWLGQFAQPALDDISGLEKIMMLNSEGSWISAEGIYAGGMGKPPVEGFALAGVIANLSGKIYTVKMVGVKNEVLAEKESLQSFVKSLRLREQ
jgi:hypothetical protein